MDPALNAFDAIRPLVVICDDEPSVREALSDLLASVSLRVEAFSSADGMLQAPWLKDANCLVLDVRLPGRSGLQLYQELVRAGVQVPVIFMTGHGDVSMAVKAMKAGAFDFLAKPFRDQDMIDAILSAIARDRVRREAADGTASLRSRFASLTVREREVMTLVTQGLLNKQVAGRLGLSEVTIKSHRRHVMSKMDVRTLPDLVRSAAVLGLHPARAEHVEPGRIRVGWGNTKATTVAIPPAHMRRPPL
jgi:FixJ family two-component response regulator